MPKVREAEPGSGTVHREVHKEDVLQDDTMISGDSMRPVLDAAKRFAETDASILLQGESGSGKELLARWIHKRSQRNAMPFVTVQCAALTEQKGEITLFGHEANRFVDTSIHCGGKIDEADVVPHINCGQVA